jgi:serine/threonine protein kinase
VNIGQYRIVDKLGTGGMGTVFLGEHILLGRAAAIKILRPALSAQKEVVERFFNEARATSAISDPGVVQVFDFGYHVDGTAYIVMELLDGEPLATRIQRVGRLPVAEALRIARQVASSLDAAHARGIIHRDLKPANIYLIRDPHAPGGERTKVLDFGICKLDLDGDPRLTGNDACLGTPVYMAPEQCRDARAADARSDLYALGGVMFHMITGRTPFICESSGDYIAAHLLEDPPAAAMFASVPPTVDALVARCLAKAPGERFQSMAELQAALDEVLAAVPSRISTETAVPVQSSFDSHQSWFLSSTPLPATTLEPVATRKRGIGRIVAAGVLAAAVGAYLMLLHDGGVPIVDIVESTRRDVAIQTAVATAASETGNERTVAPDKASGATTGATDSAPNNLDKSATGSSNEAVASNKSATGVLDKSTTTSSNRAIASNKSTNATPDRSTGSSNQAIASNNSATGAPDKSTTMTVYPDKSATGALEPATGTDDPVAMAPTNVDAWRPIADDVARTVGATIGVGWPKIVVPEQPTAVGTAGQPRPNVDGASPKAAKPDAKSNIAAKTTVDTKSNVAAKSTNAASKSAVDTKSSKLVAKPGVDAKSTKLATKPDAKPSRPAVTRRPVFAKRPAIRQSPSAAPPTAPPAPAPISKPSEDLYDTR